MRTIEVNVTVKRNWRGDKYALFSAEGYDDIAELDYPCEEHGTRVFFLKDDECDYVPLSAPQFGIIAAETCVKSFLMGKGHFNVEFNYPAEMRELRKKAVIEKRK